MKAVEPTFKFDEVVEAAFLISKSDGLPVWMKAVYKTPHGDKHVVSFDSDSPDRMVTLIRKLKMRTIIHRTADDSVALIINETAVYSDIYSLVGTSALRFRGDQNLKEDKVSHPNIKYYYKYSE